MNVSISESWEPFIRAQVQSGRYRSESEVVEESLRLMSQRDQGPGSGPIDGGGDASNPRPIWEAIDDLMRDVPEEEIARLPIDGAAQHDHYIYGTPKRPS
jgi:hypothetical protein